MMGNSIVAAAEGDLHPVERIVSELRHSDKPNIIIEGPEDRPIYQQLVASIGIFNIDFHAAEGRENLLAIYERRDEFPHKSVAFIADQDMWVFTKVPPKYKGHIIFTRGYSIENDLYVAGALENLLDCTQKSEYEQFVKEICRWKAFEVKEFMESREHRVDMHLNQIIPPGCNRLDPSFCEDRGFRPPDSEILCDLTHNYPERLRGKLLFDILIRFLQKSCLSTKYNYRMLSQIALKLPSNGVLEALQKEIKAKIPHLKSSSLSGIAKIVSKTYGAEEKLITR